MNTPISLLPKVRSDQIMAAAAGQQCTLRVSSFLVGGRCSGTDTTVACHMPVDGKGTGTKVSDLFVAFGCSNCHDLVDGRNANGQAYIIKNYPTAYMDRLLRGMAETQSRLVEARIITLAGWKMP